MKTLLTEEQLQQGIRGMADQIRRHYEGRPLTIVGVLIGSVVLLADLIRLLEIPDVFVVGYGLDHNDLYRNLPYVAMLEPGDLGEEPVE